VRIRPIYTGVHTGALFDTRTYCPYLRPVFTGSAYRSPIYTGRIYCPYIRVHFWHPYIRPVYTDRTAKTATTDHRYFVRNCWWRHATSFTTSKRKYLSSYFFVSILQVFCSNFELVKWMWSKMTLHIFRDARTHSSGPTMIASRRWFLYITQRMFVEFKMFWLQRESLVTQCLQIHILGFYGRLVRAVCTGVKNAPVRTGRMYG